MDIQIKCMQNNFAKTEQASMNLEKNWKRVCELIKWLSYEKYIDDQLEIDEIQAICETLISSGQLGQEKWKIRKNVLKDIVRNSYYDYYNCGDIMAELAENLCTTETEYLEFADILDETGKYGEAAAALYHQYGRDDKYVSYLEAHLDRSSKEYSALITYYREHALEEDAQRVAQLALERCKEDLTDSFIYLLLRAQKEGDQEQFRKLYASAKRRKHVDVERVNKALVE